MNLSTSRKLTWTVAILLLVLVCSIVGLNSLMKASLGPAQGLETRRIIVDQGSPEERLYEVEVATGPALAVGLMNRKDAPGPYEGMLFDWGQADKERSMTMYNTRFPLTVIWLDEDFNSVGQSEMEPCSAVRLFFCPEYTSPEPVRYALEVSP